MYTRITLCFLTFLFANRCFLPREMFVFICASVCVFVRVLTTPVWTLGATQVLRKPVGVSNLQSSVTKVHGSMLLALRMGALV